MPVTYKDQLCQRVTIVARPQRIISLVPSQTELLHDLGLGERVVGITKFCIHPTEWHRTKVRVGGTKKLDPERIRSLLPDLIICNKEENTREEIASLQQEFPVWCSDVRDLGSAIEMILSVGMITGTTDRAQRMAGEISDAFARLRPLPEMDTAYLIWRQPYMVAGPDTFINDMLRRCGMRHPFQSSGSRYPEATPELLRLAAPSIVLLSSEPYPFKEEHVLEIRTILPNALIMLVDGTYFSWYGSRLLHAPAYFQSVIESIKTDAE